MKLEIRDCEFGRLSVDEGEKFVLDLIEVMNRYGVRGIDGGTVRIGEGGIVSIRDFTAMT